MGYIQYLLYLSCLFSETNCLSVEGTVKLLSTNHYTVIRCMTMVKEVTVSARVDSQLAENFKTVCEQLKINPSAFLRACLIELTTMKDPEEFLKVLGFTKAGWVRKEY